MLAEMMAAGELLAAHAAGTLTASADRTELAVPPLADDGGPQCYPKTTITVTWPGDSVVLGCWVFGHYMQGPNRRDNGAYIGHGWAWQADEGDSANSGSPQVEVDGTTVLLHSGDNAGESWGIAEAASEEEADELADVLRSLIEGAYGTISVAPADDAAVAERLQRGGADEEILGLGLFAGRDAGRPVFTFEGSDEVWEDAGEAIDALCDHLESRIEAVRDDGDEGRRAAIRGLESRVQGED
jgi:hypothetical protein